MNKPLLFVIVIFIIMMLFGLVDDDLSEEATDLLSRIEVDSESESYQYLFGIIAEENEDPFIVGKKVFEEYRKAESDETFEAVGYPESKLLALPEGDVFCNSWEASCIEYLFSPDIDVEKLLTEHSLLVSRSDEFLELNEFKTLLKPGYDQIIPPYQYIAAAERIKVLAAISVYRNGDAKKAINSLLLQFAKLRSAMELQDNLIGKLILLMKLSEIIDVSSIMLSNEDIKVEMIPSLTKSERNFYMIAAREFGGFYDTCINFLRHQDGSKKRGVVAQWIIRILYKPNMTINAATPMYYRLESLATLSARDFAREVKAGEGISLSIIKLRNYAGSRLLEYNVGIEDYVARFFDFDVKLALFNQLHYLKLDVNNMKNPYYGSEVPKERDGSLCFDGPLEDDFSMRCLRVKI